VGEKGATHRINASRFSYSSPSSIPSIACPFPSPVPHFAGRTSRLIIAKVSQAQCTYCGKAGDNFSTRESHIEVYMFVLRQDIRFNWKADVTSL
jgi:hypothetical protein